MYVGCMYVCMYVCRYVCMCSEYVEYIHLPRESGIANPVAGPVQVKKKK